MSEEVEVPFGDNPGETATLLLAAAEELDLDQGVVRTITGAFMVPQEVADKADVDYDDGDDDGDDDDGKKATKKTTAKKTTAAKK